jgi:chemotaxis protein methyltransferase CheR
LEKKNIAQENTKLMILLARSYANNGNLEKAKTCIEKTLKQEKLDPELYFFYATVLQEIGKLQEAAAALKKSLFLDQNYVVSYYALGNVLFALGKKEEAERNFRNAKQLLENMDPNIFLNELGMTTKALLEIIYTSKANL